MMLLVYRLICALLALLVGAVILRSRRLTVQLSGGMLLIVLVLRLFLIK